MKYIISSFPYRFLSVKTRNEISETDMVSFRQNFHVNDLIHIRLIIPPSLPTLSECVVLRKNT